jgi:hypothetical protein
MSRSKGVLGASLIEDRADDRSLSDTDIIQAERSLYRVRHDLVAKREEIGRVTSHAEPSGGGWMGKVFGSKADQGQSNAGHAKVELTSQRSPRFRPKWLDSELWKVKSQGRCPP